MYVQVSSCPPFWSRLLARFGVRHLWHAHSLELPLFSDDSARAPATVAAADSLSNPVSPQRAAREALVQPGRSLSEQEEQQGEQQQQQQQQQQVAHHPRETLKARSGGGGGGASPRKLPPSPPRPMSKAQQQCSQGKEAGFRV